MSNTITISSGEDSDIEYVATSNNSSRGGGQDFINSGGVEIIGVTRRSNRISNSRGNARQGK
jgi:hypothetical protein